MTGTNVKKTITEIKWKLVGILGKLIIDLLFCGTRIESVGFEPVKPIIFSRKFIFSLWHSRILLFSYLYKWWHGVALVSQHEDGEFVARVLQQQGHETIRGSTTKGGLRALAKMIKYMKEKSKPGTVIPDGPQGPRFKVQPGIITLAKKTGFPIIPISYSAKKAKVFLSWDRFMLPYPFTDCRVIYGNPVYVPANSSRDEEKGWQRRLEEEMCRITHEVDRHFGHHIK
ncbi:lysophospholipid acyltransferase family protein [Thermodesulfobacteriota bacterium]